MDAGAYTSQHTYGETFTRRDVRTVETYSKGGYTCRGGRTYTRWGYTHEEIGGRAYTRGGKYTKAVGQTSDWTYTHRGIHVGGHT